MNKPASRFSQVAAVVIGNALEWYDFIVFGFLTVVIARLFFPAEDQYSGLLLTTATFAVGFFMRPVGGVVLGWYADRYGRKAALQAIIALMTLSMAMITFAPPRAAIGVAAPLVIVLARLLQGFATGGEYAIHGTNRPESIGHFVSAGCIRMHNRDIVELYRLVGVGTPVIVER